MSDTRRTQLQLPPDADGAHSSADRGTTSGADRSRSRTAVVTSGLGRLFPQDTVVRWAQFPVDSEFSFPPGFRARDVPGLLHCTLVASERGTDTFVVTYWRDSDFLRIHQRTFARLTGAVRPPSAVGDVVDGRFIRESRWPSTPFEWVEKTLMAVGGIGTIVAFWALWVAPPRVAIVSSTSGLRGLVNEQLELSVTVANLSRLGSAQVTLAPQSDTASLVDVGAGIRTITVEAGKQETMSVRVTGKGPGVATVTLAPSALGGLLGLQRPVVVPPVQVEIFSPKLVTTKFRVNAEACASSSCTVSGEVFAGRASGPLDCWAIVSNAVDFELRSVRSSRDGGRRAPRSTDGGPIIDKIEWRIDSPLPMGPNSVSIWVEGRTARSRPDWDAIANRITWTCTTPPK